MALVILVLAGCAGPPSGTIRQQPESPAKLAVLAKNWRLEGRIGVQTKQESWHASLFWEHDGSQDRLRVAGPLNQAMVSIVVQKNLILINEGNGQLTQSSNPAELLRQKLGFAVPLPRLRYWIMGVPDPGMAYSRLAGANGVDNGFTQSGWEVVIMETQNIGSTRMPRKLRVRGEGVTLKILADEWQISEG